MSDCIHGGRMNVLSRWIGYCFGVKHGLSMSELIYSETIHWLFSELQDYMSMIFKAYTDIPGDTKISGSLGNKILIWFISSLEELL